MKIHQNKRFEDSAFRTNDPQARRAYADSPQLRKAVKEIFGLDRIQLRDNPDRYGIDLLSLDGTYGVELARKGMDDSKWRDSWTDGNFSFDTIHIEQRKAIEAGDLSRGCVYVLFDHRWEWAIVVPHTAVLRFMNTPISKWCENSGLSETYIPVPASLAYYVKCREGLEGPVLRKGQPLLGLAPLEYGWVLKDGEPVHIQDDERVNLDSLLEVR